MRKVIHKVLIYIILFFLFASCEPRKPSQKISSSNVPNEKKISGKIVFEKEIHNFGTLKEGEIVSFSFKYINKGGSPFRIIKAEASCGCIEVNFAESEIIPGDSSFVSVIFNSSGEWGNQLKGAIVETSEGERKELHVGAYIDNKQFNNLLNNQK
jgi:hypothetical protein